jgi:methionine transaminase
MQSKLPDVGTTIFTVMSVLANEHKAINLGQGFPDWHMDEELVQLVHQAMIDGNNQYTHMNGLPVLRTALAQKVQELYQTSIDADTQITVTPGGTYAIYTALTSLIHPGDEVIVFEPAYDSYIPNIEVNGGVPVLIPLRFPDYSIDWELVQSKISAKTKAIIINSPHNPTGSVLGQADIAALRQLVAGTNITIISDEVYEHLIFDGKTHESILKYPDLLEQAIVCFSFGKVYHCTGWKLGYAIAPKMLMSEFRKVHQFNCFTCNTPMQVAIAQFLQNKNAYLQLGQTLQQQRDVFQQLMANTKFQLLPTHGSYFQCATYAELSDLPDKSFAVELVKKAGVATIPVSAFYKAGKDDKVLRFCFAKKTATLEQAAQRLSVLF